MNNRTVRLNVALAEETWLALRRVAETERTPGRRASITKVLNVLIVEALHHRNVDLDPRRRESR